MEHMREILFQRIVTEEENSIICMVCKNYLSVPPIVHNDTLGSICGRENCAKLANMKGTGYRQHVYEVFARFLTFPCMHRENGCQDKYGWDEIGEHEKVCKYANFVCPFVSERFVHLEETTCSWVGIASELSHHLASSHQSHRFDNHLQFNLENDIKGNRIYFTNIKESIVIILVIDEENGFYVKVWSGPEHWRKLTYKTEIYTGRAEVNVLKTSKPELIKPSFFNSKIDKSWLKVNFAYMRDIFEAPKWLAIKFYIDGVAVGPSPKSCFNPNILSLKYIKCTNCLQESKQSVYICKEAHVICCKCIVQIRITSGPPTFKIPKIISTCPKCESSKSEVSVNIPYEKLLLTVNRSFQTCVFCDENLDDLMNHLMFNHKTFNHQLDTFYSDFNNDKCYFFHFDNHIFILSKVISSDSKLSFVVECLETKKIKYKYELRLMNVNYEFLSVTFGNFCHPGSVQLTENFGSSSLSHRTSIPNEVLRDIFPDFNSIGFKLNISWI